MNKRPSLSFAVGVALGVGSLLAIAAVKYVGDGSGLSNLNGSNIASGTVSDSRLSVNVTKAGNTFNGASQLIQLDGSTRYPALNGSLITSLNGSAIASGTVPDARLSANVGLLNANQVWNGSNGFTGVLNVNNGSNQTWLVDLVLTGNFYGSLLNGSNMVYTAKTNNGNGLALVAGTPGTASTMYITNITAATTLAPFTLSSTLGSGFQLYASCSGGTDRILTFPNGCTGAGLSTPPAVTITNGKAAWFNVVCIPGLSTNVFWSPVF